jgi:UPF0755 protein
MLFSYAVQLMRKSNAKSSMDLRLGTNFPLLCVVKNKQFFGQGFIFFLGFMLLLSSCGYVEMYTKPVVNSDSSYVYVRTGQDYTDFLDSLGKTGMINPYSHFRRAAKVYGYKDSFKPGRYKLKKGMTAVEALKHLRSGKREPVTFSFHYLRTPESLAAKVASKLEPDSARVMRLLSDSLFTRKEFGLSPVQASVIFIPNTYEIHWHVSAEDFCRRMKKEYDTFWDADRKKKADAIGLSPVQVSILASLVQAEQSRVSSEWPVIAGLYLNRLKKGMLLQSDPTVVFAHRDFSLKRVLLRHLEIDSPFNTYKYSGLPPGPINMPEPAVIDAVLNAEKHDYLFMCAKEDLSGRHSFAATLAQHNRNAAAYQRALNRNGIR